MATMHTVDEQGTVTVGADAFVPLLAALPRWRLLARLWKLPLFPALARRVYAIVARNRPTTCQLPEK